MARWLVVVGLYLSLLAPSAAAQNPNVTVNEQPTAEQRLGEINELRAANRHDAAAELVQELVEQSRFKLVGTGQGRYTDAERWCKEELLRDGVLREAYRQRYTASATHALDQARLDEDPAEALAGVYQSYAATAPAFEAGLELAGRLLESGDASAATELIEELMRHPDRDTELGRLVTLRGAAAVYTHDHDKAAEVRDQLIELGLDGRAAWLASLADALGPGAFAVRPGLIDAGPKPEELSVALWDQPLASVDRSAMWVRGRAVLPVVTPSLVLVNNGRQVVAWDRASGQRLWAYPEDDGPVVTRTIGGQRWYDARAVGRDAGAVAAVLGESYGITENRNPYVPRNRLAVIDEATGSQRWERASGEVYEGEPTEGQTRRVGRANLQLTHFVGTPIIARGQVLALLRRANSNSSSQTTWLMSFDLEDGTLRWYRHLALASLSYSSDQSKVAPQMALHGDTLYLTDCIASVAAVDIRRGGYRWLRVLPVGYGQAQRLTLETDGTLSPPVLTHAGLMVPLALSRDRLVLLDPGDGSTLQTFENHPQVGQAQYLMDGGDGAVVVSAKSVAFWDAGDAEVAWTFPFDPSEKAQGRGDVTRRFVIVPTTTRLLVLDRETGRLLDEAESPGGNVTVRDGEVLATSAERLYSYTSWRRAYQRLVDRAEQQPTDPTAGLALASLAIRLGGQADAAIQGVGYAIRAIENQTPAQAVLTRERVFGQLRALAIEPSAMDERTRRLLYDRLALVTHTATQEATYHLDAGRFHAAQNEPGRAVEHFQSVVADTAFASQPYERRGVTRSAGAVAQQEILQLIETHGRSVYGRYDALARAQLAEIKAAGEPDASALAMIARRYPMSLAAVEALLEAGQRLEAQGKQAAAIGLYQQAVVRAGHSRQRQLSVGHLLTFYLNAGRPAAAAALLEREGRLYPDLYPIDAGKPLPPSVWQQRIALAPTPDRVRPALAEKLTTPFMLPGRLTLPAPGIDGASLSGRLYLQHEDGTLSCHAAENARAPLWSAALPAEAMRWYVVADNAEQVLIWSADTGVIASLDPATGQTQWATPMGFASEAPWRLDPLPGEAVGRYLVSLSDAVVCFGHRESAQIVAIDRAGGGVLWRTELVMTELTALDCDAWTLAAAGRIGRLEQAATGKLGLLSLFTGEPQTEHPELRVNVAPRSVALVDRLVILCGTAKIVAVESETGDELWSRAFADRRLTGAVATTPSLIAAATDDGMVHLLDTHHSGRLLGSVQARGRSDPEGLTLQAADEQVWVTGGRGVMCLGRSPVLQWQDAISLPDRRPLTSLVGEERVALFVTSDIDPGPGQLATAKACDLFIFNRAGGRLVNQYTLGPADNDPAVADRLDPAGAQLFGKGLVVPVGWRTMVVPGLQ